MTGENREYPTVLMNVILRFKLDCTPKNKKNITTFREEAASALVSFHMTSVLVELEFGVLFFKKGGRPKNPAKNP